MRAFVLVLPLFAASACGLAASGLGSGASGSTTGSGGAHSSSTSTSGSGIGGGTGGASSSSSSSGNDGGPTDWAEMGFGYRVKIMFDNSLGAEDLVDFPVPIVLTSAIADFKKMEPQGQDIRFTDALGAEVGHEIEQWQPMGPSTLWVRVPIIHAGVKTDYLWLYYGKPGAPDAQNPPDVWKGGFLDVYHLGDDLQAAAPQVKDSTGLLPARDGTWKGASGAGSAACVFGDGIHVKNGAYVDAGNLPDYAVSVGKARTIEAWFQAEGSVASPGFIVDAEGCCKGYRLGIGDEPGNPGAVQGNMGVTPGANCCTNVQFHPFNTSGQSYASGWHYAVLVVDRSSMMMRLHVDGAQKASRAVDNTAMGDNGALLRLGANWQGQERFTGFIDEMRISDAGRSSAWIAAQHLAMTNGFTSFGAIEAYTP